MSYFLIAALFSLGCALGFGLGGLISDMWGKRLTMSASNLAALFCWIISANAEEKWLLYGSYSLQGLFGAVSFNCIGIYIAETSHPSLRRLLCPLVTISMCLGFLLGYTTCAWVSWRSCNLILATMVTLPASISILFCKETPHWLVKKHFSDKAR